MQSTVFDDPHEALHALAERPDVLGPRHGERPALADADPNATPTCGTGGPSRCATTRRQAIERHVRAGGGLLACHTAAICFDGDPRVGGLHRRHLELGPVVAPARWARRSISPTAAGRTHPITAGIAGFTTVDEVYGFLDHGADLEPAAHQRPRRHRPPGAVGPLRRSGSGGDRPARPRRAGDDPAGPPRDPAPRGPLADGTGPRRPPGAPDRERHHPMTDIIEITVSTYAAGPGGVPPEGAAPGALRRGRRGDGRRAGEPARRDHRARRRLENRLFRKDTHRRYERELFPPVVAATLAPHVASGRAELVTLSHEMMMNLAAFTAGVDRPQGTRDETMHLYAYLMLFIQGATLAHYTGDREAKRAEVAPGSGRVRRRVPGAVDRPAPGADRRRRRRVRSTRPTCHATC